MNKKKSLKIKNLFSARSEVNEMPGKLSYIGEVRTDPPFFNIIQYNDKELFESGTLYHNYEKHLKRYEEPHVTWLDLEGLSNTELTESIGKRYCLHNLLLEDILNTLHRPKLEQFDEATLVIAKMLTYSKEDRLVQVEQVSFVITTEALITFQEWEGDVFEPVRDRIRKHVGKIRVKGNGYLLFSLLDAIVDNYYTILEQIEDELETLELKILDNPSENVIYEVHHYKRQLSVLRKAIFPMREIVNSILKGTGNILNEENEWYFRDLYDNIIQSSEMYETNKDIVNGLQELGFSNISNKMNNIMKTLTVVSSVFIPLTFVAGVYGMNFDFMPELHWKYGYAFFWGVTSIIFIGLAVLFKRLKWW